MKGKSSVNLEVSLVEIIFSVFIFAVLGVIILNCFAMARVTQIKANDETLALMKTQTFFEYIKSSKSSEEMDEILGKLFDENYYVKGSNKTIYVDYYDQNWNKCNVEDSLYSISISISGYKLNSGNMKNIDIRVDRVESYPFDKQNNKSIFYIETKKFFPEFLNGRK
nr:hypothetical protein [Sedimentibacter sp.]